MKNFDTTVYGPNTRGHTIGVSRTELLQRFGALSLAAGQSNLTAWHYIMGGAGSQSSDAYPEICRVQRAMATEMQQLTQALWPSE